MFYNSWTDNVSGVVAWSGRTASVAGDEVYWISNRGVWFNGSDMVVALATNTFMQHVDFTVSTWIRAARSVASDEVLYSINKPNPVAPGDEDFISVALNTSFLKLKIVRPSGQDFESVSDSPIVTQNTWSIAVLAVEYSGRVYSFTYFGNIGLVSTDSLSDTDPLIDNYTNTHLIGAELNGNSLASLYMGMMYEFKIYSYALTSVNSLISNPQCGDGYC